MMQSETDVIKNNIFHQFDVSRELFDLVPELAKVAAEDDRAKREELAGDIMQKLLKAGEELSEGARSAGTNLSRLVKQTA